jgi:hypothetical protein
MPAAVAMTADDGGFDESRENVSAVVDTSGLGEGRHTVFVHGEDASGQWGSVTAALFFVLDPATAPRLEGTVVDADSGDPLLATVVSGLFTTSTDPVDGSYSMLLAEGTYEVTASAEGYGAVTIDDVVAVSGATTVVDFELHPIRVVLEDDVEGGNIGWSADPPWAITDEASASPTHSWTDSPGGSYGNRVDVSLTSPGIDLSSVGSVSLEFSHIYEIEDGWDYGLVEYSVDGGATWSGVASFTGAQTASWDRVVLPLPALDGVADARVRFRLDTDWSETRDGWHVDDIVVRGADSPPAGLVFEDGFESGDVSAWAR